MKVTIKGDQLSIIGDIANPPVPSGTGKNLIILSTRGPMRTNATINGKRVTVVLKAYIPK